MGNNSYSPEMEESLLSCVLKSGELYNILKDICGEKDFWFLPYSLIWGSFKKLYDKNSNIDIITVQDELERNNNFEKISSSDGSLNGYDLLVYLKNKENVNTNNSETYAKQVKDDSGKRRIQEITNKSSGWINQGNDTITILTNLELELGKISAYVGANIKSITSIGDAVDQARRETELASKQNRKYIETGIKALDEKIGGLFPGQLVTIAARTGMGKSALAQTIALNAAVLNKPWRNKVGIFTLEMKNTEYVNRMISALTGIPSLRMKMGKFFGDEAERYNAASDRIKDGNYIYLDDTNNINMPLIRNKIRKMKESGVEMVILDQLALVMDRYPNEQEYVRIDRMSYQLKNMASEFDIPIINIQQMNRSIESVQRTSQKEPKTSDLTQAGESAPNVILMLSHEMDKKVIKSSKIWIVKNREGPTGCVDVKFEAEKTYFRDLTKEELDAQTPDFMK